MVTSSGRGYRSFEREAKKGWVCDGDVVEVGEGGWVEYRFDDPKLVDDSSMKRGSPRDIIGSRPWRVE